MSWSGYQLGIQLPISLIWVLRLVLAVGNREHTHIVLYMGLIIRIWGGERVPETILAAAL